MLSRLGSSSIDAIALIALSLENQIKALDRQLSQTDDPLARARIYLQAAKLYSASEEIDEACFFMTQAFIFAVDTGDKKIEQEARRFLKENGRI